VVPLFISTEKTTNEDTPYTIPLSLRKPFKIPLLNNAVTPGIIPTSLTTPKSRHNIIRYGRVLQYPNVASAGTDASEPSNPTNGLPTQQTNKIRFRVPASNVTEQTEKHPEDNLPTGPTASTKEKGTDKEDLYIQENQISLNTQGNKQNSQVEVTNPMGKNEPSNSTLSVNANSIFALEDPPTNLSNKGEITHASTLDTASTWIADTNVKGGTLGALSHNNVTTFACAHKVQPSNGNNNIFNQNQNQITFGKQTLTNDTQKNLPYSATITQPLYLTNPYINNPLQITPTAAPTKNNSLQNIPTGKLYKYGFANNSITPKENYMISLEPEL
jgi:hypothetical protein